MLRVRLINKLATNDNLASYAYDPSNIYYSIIQKRSSGTRELQLILLFKPTLLNVNYGKFSPCY